MTDSFSDNQGNAVPASFYDMRNDWPMEMQISVSFEDYEGKGRTMLLLRHSGIKNFSSKDWNNMRQGWNESLDKLDSEIKCIY